MQQSAVAITYIGSKYGLVVSPLSAFAVPTKSLMWIQRNRAALCPDVSPYSAGDVCID